MDVLRQRIVVGLQKALPELAESIKPFYGFEDEQNRGGTYASGGILVCIVGAAEADTQAGAPWPLRLDYGLIISVKEASAIERDRKGWILAMKVAKVVFRNSWGYERGIDIQPAVITSISKQSRRRPDGTFDGVNYWPLTFFHNSTEEVAIGLK